MSTERGKFLKCYKPMMVPFAVSDIYMCNSSQVYAWSAVQVYLITAWEARRNRLQYKED